jgi:hypothetical protein
VNLRAQDERDALLRTLEDLAAFGEKRAGTDAGRAAGDYVAERFRKAGLSGVRFDPFRFPQHRVHRAELEVRVAGAPLRVGFEALEACGPGRFCGPLVFAGWADQPETLRKQEWRSRVALVERNPLLHRSTQYLNIAEAGAAAMISISSAPDNLTQVGSVRRAWEAHGGIPALSIGGADGRAIKDALAAHRRVEIELDVSVGVHRGEGRNIVGVVPGEEPAMLIVGAHYDTWFAGSSDNGAGVAALLALAERRARRHERPRYTLVFVAWDGEELALYGGYHHLRELLRDERPVLAVIDFETPSAHGAQAYGLARSAHPPLGASFQAVGLHELYALDVGMEMVPELFGGVIPTDVQGHYRHGTPAVATASDAPYYHTVGDTPDKVDLQRLLELVDGFDRALDELMTHARESFQPRDPSLWTLDVELQLIESGLIVDARALANDGVPRSLAHIEATLFTDDFFEVATRRATSDAHGRATMVLPRPDGPAHLHVTAGPRYPLVERVLFVDVTNMSPAV